MWRVTVRNGPSVEKLRCQTLPEALDKRRTLLSGESVITRDGVWIGREWLRVSRHDHR